MCASVMRKMYDVQQYKTLIFNFFLISENERKRKKDK